MSIIYIMKKNTENVNRLFPANSAESVEATLFPLRPFSGTVYKMDALQNNCLTGKEIVFTAGTAIRRQCGMTQKPVK